MSVRANLRVDDEPPGEREESTRDGTRDTVPLACIAEELDAGHVPTLNVLAAARHRSSLLHNKQFCSFTIYKSFVASIVLV